MQRAKWVPWSEVEYLRAEREGVLRHEYLAGQIFAMAGGSKAHNIIALNVAARLRAHLRGRPCRAFIADMKVRLEHAQCYYYPDVVVTCHPRDMAPEGPADYLIEPALIIEVLSASTETTDRREKLPAYMRLPGPVEYVLIDSSKRQIEIYRKAETGEVVQEIPAPGESVNVDSVGLCLTFEAIYEDSGVE